MDHVPVKRFVLLASLLFVSSGCYGSGTVPTKGTVKLEGKALEGATVLFLTQESGGRDARGATDAHGAFRLTTFQLNDGALPGKYKVVVQPPAPLTTGGNASTPQDAQRAAAEGLITSKEPTIVIAARFTEPGQTVLEQTIPAKAAILLDLTSK